MDQNKRLTVALIARDAGEFIGETLDSVRSIADQLLVIDCSSSDNTAQVASQHGASVIPYEWADDFSAARNFGLQHANGDWILWLDAGEQLEDASAVRRFVDSEANPREAYMMIVYVPPIRAGLDGEQVGRTRLMPVADGLQFSGMIREDVAASMDALGIETSTLPVRILRSMREHDLAVRASRAKRNIKIADAQIRSTEPTARMLNCLGDAFQVLDDHGRAMLLYRHGLKASERGSVDMLESYYGLLTSCDKDGDRADEQLQICLEALEIFPLDAQLLCAMANYLQAQGRIDLASRAYETAYQFGQVNPYTWHLDRLKEVSTICFSLTLQLQKQDEKARAIVEQAVAEDPAATRLWRHLMDLHIKLGQRDEALAIVDRNKAEFSAPDAMRSAVRGACLAAEKNWIAARAYLDAAHSGGCDDPLCLRWLSITLLSVGQIERAVPVLQEWQSKDPENTEVTSYLEAIKNSEQQADQQAESEATPESPVEARQMRVDEPGSAPLSPRSTPAMNPLNVDRS